MDKVYCPLQIYDKNTAKKILLQHIGRARLQRLSFLQL